MKRFVPVFLVSVLLGLMLFPYPSGEKLTHPRPLPSSRELQMKAQLVGRDLRLTDELSRGQSALEFAAEARRLAALAPGGPEERAELDAFRSAHPHVPLLVWGESRAPLARARRSGTLPPALAKSAEHALAAAHTAAAAGREYRSAPLQDGGGAVYFVLGVPAPDRRFTLLGVIRQDILAEVERHQHKNLRLVPYPPTAGMKTKAVDPHSLADVKVKHPEDNQGTSHFRENEIVVKFRTPPTVDQLRQIRRETKATSVTRLGHAYIFKTDGHDPRQLIPYFQKHNVEYAEPHYLYLTNESIEEPADPNLPNDLLYAKYQWNLPVIDTEQGWSLNKGSSNVTVGVLDTGADLEHPDLAGRLADGYNVVQPNAPPQDDVGHGTHVTGVIAALVNNGIGVAGMTWYNPVLPVKVLDHTGAGNTYSVAQGLIWATDHGAKVVNMSLGNYADANLLHDAVRYAFDHDVVMISASGNDNTSQPGYPAAYPEVFAVAAIDSDRSRAPFSNYGDYIDAAAPGVSIASTYPGNRYAALSGTSMASPHVAAVAALIRSANPSLKNTEVMDIMRKSAVDLGDPGHDAYFGYGQIDVAGALAMARGQTGAVAPEKTGTAQSTAAGTGSTQSLWDRLLNWFR